MIYRTDDTIAAIASAPGGSVRGVIRVSGPGLLSCLRGCVFPAARGDWGEVAQSIVVDGHSLVLSRHTRITQRDLLPADFLAARTALNELRSAHGRTILLKP